MCRYNASCNWLKSVSPSVYEAWTVPVIRYQCLNGCGLPDSNGNVYGGTCDYMTGQCICDVPELFSSGDCKTSCPGLLGPNINGDFMFCGGNGICDTTTTLCTCNLGYGGSGCTIKYENYTFDTALGGGIIGLSGLLAAIAIGCIVWLRVNAHYKTVKALSVDMTTVMSVGLAMLALSNVPAVIEVSSATCIAWQWLFGLGGILSIMSPLLKAYRVSRVFHGGKMLRAVKITDKMLLSTLVKAAALEVCICVGYSFCHEQFGGIHQYYNHDELRIETQCNDDDITSYLSMGMYYILIYTFWFFFCFSVFFHTFFLFFICFQT